MLNTKWVRKNAVSEILGDLFTHTCKYSPDTPAAGNSLIEPDVDSLGAFRGMLAHLADLAFNDELTVHNVSALQRYVRTVGYPLGHVTSGYLTGTWGVRFSDLDTLKQALSIPDYDLLPMKTPVQVYGEEWFVYEYRVHTNWLFITVVKDVYGNGRFEISKSWKELADPTWVTERVLS